MAITLSKAGPSVIQDNTTNGIGNSVYANPKYRNPDIPAEENISVTWNTDTTSYDYEGIWDD